MPQTSLTATAAATEDDAVVPTCRDVPIVGMAVSEIGSTQWLDVNPTLCEFLGYSREELLSIRWADVTHPDDQAQSRELKERAQRGEMERYRVTKRYFRKDGQVVHAMLDVRVVKHRGVARWLLAAIVDIGEQIQARATARDAASMLERFSENMPGIFYEFVLRADGSTSLPYASHGMHALFGFVPGSLEHDASPFFTRIHPADLERVAASIQVSAENLSPWMCEFRYLSPSMAERWFRGESRPRREPDGSTRWLGFMSDATHWYQQQEALAQSERQLRFLFEHAAEGILLLDAQASCYVDVNPRAEAILGYDRSALLGRSPADVSAPVQPDGSSATDYISRVLTKVDAEGSYVGEWNGLHADGHIIPCELRITPLPETGRRLFRGTIVDITERRRAQAALRRLQIAIDSSMNGVAMADAGGTLTYVNRAFLSLWGFTTSGEVLGRSVAEFWQDPTEAERVTSALLTDGRWAGELKATHRDGRSRVMEVNASVVRDEDGGLVGMLASFADGTETRRLEQELNQSQKLESIGRLAGGVAHDFNNLLTVIKASLDLAIGEIPMESPARTDLREVAKAADSAARLTQQLLAFSRKQIIDPTTLNLNEIVQRVAAMLQRLLGEDISLRTVTAHDLGWIRFDAGQAEQILVNLAVNARDAMPEGGTLTVETRNVHATEDFGRRHPGVRPGEYVLLTVSDTGAGMSDEVLTHAFEPFFTTKAAGKGTGLGLAVIHGAVTQNGGRVDVTSELGKGTRFSIYLPRVAGPVEPAEEQVPGPLMNGTEVVLLVEDDQAVRNLLTRLLTQHGYRVFAFEAGAQALEWLGMTREAVDLLLTDVIMPAMNGRQLAEAVVQRRPDIRVLYASGYTANVIAHHGVFDAEIPFLPKPFDVRELLSKVREALGRPRVGLG